MVPELEKPRVTEINARMDCNGCVQKIKKALHGINGIYDMYIDFPQQKVTIIGWADPEKIVKAIKKTRKLATICAHVESTDQANPPTEQAQADTTNPPAAEASPSQPGPPPQENPKPPDNPPTQEEPPLAVNEANVGQPSKPKDVEEVYVIYHHPPESRYGYNHVYGGPWNNNRQGFPVVLPQPIYTTHNYNTSRPSPYVTEYEYLQPSPPPQPPIYTQFNRMDNYNYNYNYNYNDDYRVTSTRTNNNGNISSMFSDENPNACKIM